MNAQYFRCADCVFCQSAFVPDFSRTIHAGERRPRKSGFICCVRPPIAAAQQRPVTEANYFCALWTAKNGAQPLRHLLATGGEVKVGEVQDV